ncbi:hypothetical protein BD626DRAFT_572391 [Schizophyllum amplum]|uniref:Uncharacterized protein n=1 Tax=Schizophyllum amplum TaxID=97359 RepID=A0A550C4H9_9AGAR|nr:hypothetical protein BD626DRAFT_572391 [Auriculariopsis ampla]
MSGRPVRHALRRPATIPVRDRKDSAGDWNNFTDANFQYACGVVNTEHEKDQDCPKTPQSYRNQSQGRPISAKRAIHHLLKRMIVPLFPHPLPCLRARAVIFVDCSDDGMYGHCEPKVPAVEVQCLAVQYSNDEDVVVEPSILKALGVVPGTTPAVKRERTPTITPASTAKRVRKANKADPPPPLATRQHLPPMPTTPQNRFSQLRIHPDNTPARINGVQLVCAPPRAESLRHRCIQRHGREPQADELRRDCVSRRIGRDEAGTSAANPALGPSDTGNFGSGSGGDFGGGFGGFDNEGGYGQWS